MGPRKGYWKNKKDKQKLAAQPEISANQVPNQASVSQAPTSKTKPKLKAKLAETQTPTGQALTVPTVPMQQQENLPSRARPPPGQPTQSLHGLEASVHATYPKMSTDDEIQQYINVCQQGRRRGRQADFRFSEELKTIPLFSCSVLRETRKRPAESAVDSVADYLGSMSLNGTANLPSSSEISAAQQEPFVQYGVLGHDAAKDPNAEDPIMLNTDTPWSAFICGVQGSGKSHTLSCMLENCLLPSAAMRPYGVLQNPLAGVVFHYDDDSFADVCEAAHLCSASVHVNVLVSPSNEINMRRKYEEAFEEFKGMINVMPLRFVSKNLTSDRMLKLMAFDPSDGHMPLYMEMVVKTLRDMSTLNQRSGLADVIDFDLFERTVNNNTDLSPQQRAPLNMRMDLLKGFMNLAAANSGHNPFACAAGSLTIVDLTDPFLNAASACVLFDVCLSVFLEQENLHRVIALDEAHKYLNNSSIVAADMFTESLLKTIRLQRHNATRLIIATQEPTVSTTLLDLCSMSIIHRFSSPAWFYTIRDHLGGASDLVIIDEHDQAQRSRASQMLTEIANLDVGESLLFAPTARLRFDNKLKTFEKLGMKYIKLKTRPRLSADGGLSKQAVRM